MKKILFSILLVFLLVGCGKKDVDDVFSKLEKKVSSSDGYYLEGTLEMVNNETTYIYDVDVSYEKEEKFRVSLKNQTNDHQQVILRNEDGVYVITPSLNKSFKFQSEWPYNNSQAYLLQTLLKDIKNDPEKTFEKNDDNYIFTTKVNYSNNKDLTKQKIYIDKNINFEKVEVLNNEDIVQIRMVFEKIDLKKNYENEYFALEKNIETTSTTSAVTKIDDIIYPMYLPKNTTLTSQNKVAKTNGERVILTFGGDSSFTFVQETATIEDEFTTIPMHGEPTFLYDSFLALSTDSASWVSNGIEYYIFSSDLPENELVKIASSINLLPVIK